MSQALGNSGGRSETSWAGSIRETALGRVASLEGAQGLAGPDRQVRLCLKGQPPPPRPPPPQLRDGSRLCFSFVGAQEGVTLQWEGLGSR